MYSKAHALGNAGEDTFLASSRCSLLFLPSFLINVILCSVGFNLLTNELQSRKVESHFVFLAREDSTERGADIVEHGPHHLAGNDLAVVCFEHKEQHTAGERDVPLSASPDVEEREERLNLREWEDKKSVLEGGGWNLLHDVEQILLGRDVV